jgi:choline kinase
LSKVIILAAGEGTRLRPFTNDRPKCLVEIQGKTLLERQLHILRSHNISDITLLGGYRSEMLQDMGCKVITNPRFSETNMVWTLFTADSELNGEIIVSYGDIVYSPKILEKLLDLQVDIAVVVDLEWEKYWSSRFGNPLDDAESLILDENNLIVDIGRKNVSSHEIQGQYIGLIKFSARGILQLKDTFQSALKRGEILGRSPESAYMTDLLQLMINEGKNIHAVKTSDCWVEIDTTSDFCSENTLTRISIIDAEC